MGGDNFMALLRNNLKPVGNNAGLMRRRSCLDRNGRETIVKIEINGIIIFHVVI